MTYDCFLFNGEHDLLEIRLNILDHYVDRFVLVESNETFSGKPKPLYYEQNKARYAKYHHKIIHHIVGGYSDAEWAEAKASPNTQGLDHWCREFVQRENIKIPLRDCKDSDVIFVGDVDEVWNPEHMTYLRTAQEVERMKLDVYAYYLNNHSSEQFWGTIYGKYKDIKNESLNHLRTDARKTEGAYGWHFTSMGGKEEIVRKIESYGHQEFNTPQIKDNLDKVLMEGSDYIGRDFTFRVDEMGLPQYLLDNKAKYGHLFK